MSLKIKKSGADVLLSSWVIEDIKISTYELCKRLKRKGINISAPTVAKWRDAFLKNNDIKNLQQARGISENDTISKYNEILKDKAINTIDKYFVYISEVRLKITDLEKLQQRSIERQAQRIAKRVDIAKKAQKRYLDKAGKGSSATNVDDTSEDNDLYLDPQDAEFTRDMDIEKIIIQYWRLLDSLYTKMLRLTGGAEYITQIKGVVENITLIAIETFFPHIQEDKREQVKKLYKKKINEFTITILEELPEKFKKDVTV